MKPEYELWQLKYSKQTEEYISDKFIESYTELDDAIKAAKQLAKRTLSDDEYYYEIVVETVEEEGVVGTTYSEFIY